MCVCEIHCLVPFKNIIFFSFHSILTDTGSTQKCDERFKRIEKRSMKRTVEDLLKDEIIETVNRPSVAKIEENPAAIEDSIEVTNLETIEGKSPSKTIENHNLVFSHDSCIRENLKLKEKIQILEAEVNFLQTRVQLLMGDIQ